MRFECSRSSPGLVLLPARMRRRIEEKRQWTACNRRRIATWIISGEQAPGLDACRRRKLLILCARRLTTMVNVRRLFTYRVSGPA